MSADSITVRNEEKNIQAREDTRASERYLKPAVSIIETDEGLELSADIPGAAKDTLEVDVEKGVLTIKAPVSHSMPGHTVYKEFELTPYFRQFQIPEILNNEKAFANYNNGVLALKIPKAEMAKPRKIEVKIG